MRGIIGALLLLVFLSTFVLGGPTSTVRTDFFIDEPVVESGYSDQVASDEGVEEKVSYVTYLGGAVVLLVIVILIIKTILRSKKKKSSRSVVSKTKQVKKAKKAKVKKAKVKKSGRKKK